MEQLLILALIASIVMGIQLAMRYVRSMRLRYWMGRGMDAYKSGHFDEAVRAFRKCVRITPGWLYARTLMSICLAHGGDRDGAAREIKLIEALQPREAETWALISTFHALCARENDEALLRAFEQLAALDARAAFTLLEQPVFTQHRAAPRLSALRERIVATGKAPVENS